MKINEFLKIINEYTDGKVVFNYDVTNGVDTKTYGFKYLKFNYSCFNKILFNSEMTQQTICNELETIKLAKEVLEAGELLAKLNIFVDNYKDKIELRII